MKGEFINLTWAWDKEKICVPDRNRTHDLRNTGKLLLVLLTASKRLSGLYSSFSHLTYYLNSLRFPHFNKEKEIFLWYWHPLYACPLLVQTPNSPFFPPLIGVKPGRAKRESRITCIRMLRTNQSKTIPRCSRQCVAQCLFQVALFSRSE